MIPLGGSAKWTSLELSFAFDVGTDVLFVRCKANLTLLEQLKTLAHILGYDILKKRTES